MNFRPLAALLFLATPLLAQKSAPAAAPSPWGDFVEKDFPFFSSVLDCRDLGEGFPKDNLTPRGLILNLGHNLWACFDTDLLRIACIWEGEEGKPPVTPDALAPGSYHVAGQKTKDGQEYLPKPIGKVWLANGIYPGWQVGEKPDFSDPREPAPSKEEVGRGSLGKKGHFEGISLTERGACLHYEVGGRRIKEWLTIKEAGPYLAVQRSVVVGPGTEALASVFGSLPFGRADSGDILWVSRAGNSVAKSFSKSGSNEVRFHSLPPRDKSGEFLCAVGRQRPPVNETGDKINYASRDPQFEIILHSLWPQTITTTATLGTAKSSYAIDDIPLPLDNPWKRNVRLADIAFLNDQGDAAGVTFDGDVWLISGLKGDLEKVTWKRFASGLHEPMSIVAQPAMLARTDVESIPKVPLQVFVFDRNGIWKLVDTNGDKECDRYEMFCNLFAQTAETREFPNSMKLGPKGELYISKGGQEGTTIGKHNGTVIKVAADGKSFEVIGYGLRQPFIGVNEKTGLVTASDQQGNYVPSTPLHIISDHHFYGHLPTIAPKEKYPETITEPLTWIPHPVNPSGVTQTWLLDAKMGPVNDELIHIGYNRPELFRVLINTRFERPQAAVTSFSRDFDFPTLNAKVNPADGQLYVVGFQVWGTVVKKISGLARVRYTGGERVLLKEVTPTDKGLLLRFNAKLDPTLATNPDSYNAERWNYRRTPDYGSPHLKLDGSTGQEWMTASSAYLSEDGKSVLVGFPDMKAGVHQMRIGWGLKGADGSPAQNAAYFSPWEVLTFDAKKEGFGDIQVDLTPRKATTVAAVKPTAEEGERLYQMFGCMACHSTDGTLVGKVGPSWKGLYGTEREIAKGTKGKFKADEAYLRESILNPSAKVVKGFEKFDTGMPIYAGILNDSQIESLILYIKSLK
ncbi:cytochrome c [Prosthecobacter sp.]|uniref:c-type cytochrome n=1 Tax=Prosthecobacter sp. TaxID=1965333 RepID=UPI001DD005EB|nr:cytochrome c [Prosthecobacter sp.]MCB1278318.1 c-type cytochrome [Prosthecobacter sp.]